MLLLWGAGIWYFVALGMHEKTVYIFGCHITNSCGDPVKGTGYTQTLQENPRFPTEFSVGKHEITLLKQNSNRITNGKNGY